MTISFEEARSVQSEAESRAKRELGMPIGSGLQPSTDGWAVKLYVQGMVENDRIRAEITTPIRGVAVVVDEIEPVRLQASSRRR